MKCILRLRSLLHSMEQRDRGRVCIHDLEYQGIRKAKYDRSQTLKPIFRRIESADSFEIRLSVWFKIKLLRFWLLCFSFIKEGSVHIILCKFPNSVIKIKKEFLFEMEEKNPLNPLQLTLLGICFVFVLIGIVSNIAMILNFKQKDLKIRFNSLIILCAIFDLTTICTFVLTVISYFTKAPVAIFLFVDDVAFNCSAFTMTTITLERYLVLCKNK